MSQHAQVNAKKSIYIVWIIPFIAMALAGWMIFKHYDGKGYEITIVFDNGDGMVVGKTPLMYNGINIGKITDMQIHAGDISKVDITITVDKKAKGVARQGNIFWKVAPTVSLTEVTGLSTILSGVYIGVMPSVKDPKKLFLLPEQTVFEAAKEEPINIFEPGILLTLHAKDSDIKDGAPLLYKKVTVGKVLDVKLVPSGVDYLIHIDQEFAYLVKDSSEFWKISGMEMRASLAGIRIEMDSLASVIAGGISLSSPPEGRKITQHNSEFKLYENKAHLALVDDCITLISNDGYNIDIKAAHIFFKGANAGDIISLDYDPSRDQTTFKIKLKSGFRHLANRDAHFWIVEPRIGLTSIKGLGAIASGPYISFETSSKSKELKDSFTLYKDAPTIKGKHFRLIANQSFNLKNGVNVIFKDIIIGSVQKLTILQKSKQIAFDIVIAQKYAHLINDSSDFYIQGAMEMGASFEGLYLNIGSITSMVNGGIVLETQDDSAKSSKRKFDLFANYKELKNQNYLADGGKYFTLTAKNLDSIKKESPILYKGIKVGKVLSFKLNKVKDLIELNVYITKEYSDQVNASTSFYNVSGIQVKAGLNGLKLQTGSIESIITGGISFKTSLQAKKVDNRHIFTLFKDEDAVDEQYVNVSFLMKEESGLKEGSAILYKSIVIGEVKSMKLVDDEVIVSALVKEEHQSLLVADSIFWVEDVAISIDHIKNPGAILSGAFIKLQKGSSVEQARKFALTNTPPIATLNQKGLRVLVTGKKLGSLKVGSPIFYRQIQIGSVEGVRLSDNAKGVQLNLYIDKCYAYLVRKNSLFYNAGAIGVDVSLFGVKISTETVSTMINGGIAMVTPDEAEEKATDKQMFELFTSPEEDWLEFEPELINDDLTCKEAS